MKQTKSALVETSLLNQTMCSVTINGTEFRIKALSDNHPDMELVYKLWYEVYVEELKYPITEGVNHTERKLRVEPNGSLVFCAFEDETCVGTLRTTHSCVTSLEFEYHKWVPEENLAEITKLIISKKYRNTFLSACIMVNTFKFHEGVFNEMPYNFLVCHTKLNLFYYYKLFGWQKLTGEMFVHPVIGYKCFLLKNSKRSFEKACTEMEDLIGGNYYTKLKWGVKHFYYKHTRN